MILYFSGTGNSQFVAKQIANIIDDEVISINQHIKEAKNDVFHTKKPLVFVVPTYSWRIPKIVDRWIRNTNFTGNRKAYFILTCGGSVGNAQAYTKSLCNIKGFEYQGLYGILMPENYLALAPTPSEEECLKIIREAKQPIEYVANCIKENTLFPELATSIKDKIISGPVNPLFYSLFVKDKAFHVSDVCTHCGKCAKRCPLHNIDMVNKKPMWKGTCTHCMSCIAGCPVKAIDYKSKTQKYYHHFIMED